MLEAYGGCLIVVYVEMETNKHRKFGCMELSPTGLPPRVYAYAEHS